MVARQRHPHPSVCAIFGGTSCLDSLFINSKTCCTIILHILSPIISVHSICSYASWQHVHETFHCVIHVLLETSQRKGDLFWRVMSATHEP